MRILYILKHNPWGIGGGCYACRNYLELFTELFKDSCFDVLICSEYLESQISKDFVNCTFYPVSPRNKISQYLSPVTQILHRHQQVAVSMIKKNQYDYCIFDHNSIAGSLVSICKKKGIKTIVLNHNCELEYFRDNNSWLKNLLLLPSVRKNERKAYLKCDYNIFLTDEDRDLFKNIYGESGTKTVVGGCFLRKGDVINHSVMPFNAACVKLVISGTIGNVQNRDGINFFLDELYEYLPENIEVVITGRNPTEEIIKKVAKLKNVSIIANPADILEIVGKCDVLVCPTRLGGGMKLRLIDGLRCGLPVISHKVSARGYTAFVDKGIVCQFETAEEFGSCLVKVIDLIQNGKIDKTIIGKCAEDIFSFEAALKRLKIDD